ncbi:hypothetical protein CYMTET_32890 [Cymbomonas tetramitiformis]|uniref:Uncharacterized protein n=1 Tax=Cymbomonas tetramitiformis TaxID=36881 RepID=A0AAE0KRS0_9CHLO|nr:hypothetical protein CYMTET_32890 [Cymbomonas tetramitiformis]
MIGLGDLEEGCSHCKAVNHKLAVCPVLAKKLRDATRSGERSPSGPLSVASSSSKASTRSSAACYYCRMDGHGIAVCPALEDKKKRTARAQEQQKKSAARVQEHPRLRESKRPVSGQPKCCICQGTGHTCYGEKTLDLLADLPGNVRQPNLRHVEAIAPLRHAEAIAAWLEHADRDMREAAVKALRRLGEHAAAYAEAIAARLEDANVDRLGEHAALYAGTMAARLEHGDRDVRSAAVAALGSLGEDASPYTGATAAQLRDASVRLRDANADVNKRHMLGPSQHYVDVRRALLDALILSTGATLVLEKPTHHEIAAVDYFENTSNLRNTPYHASTREVLTDHLTKTFQYAENVMDVLKARGYHPKGSGITLDGVHAKCDYFALRSAMTTVLDSVDSLETAKIFDFDLAYSAYNYDINAIVFTMLSVLLRGPALDAYHSTAKHYPFDGHALLLCLHFDVEGVQRGEKGKCMEEMRASRIDDRVDPNPLLQSVCTLADEHRRYHTRTSTTPPAWRPSASPAFPPPAPDSGGEGDSPPPSSGGRVMAQRSRIVFAAEGKWEDTGGPYCIWNGQGHPCVVCYRVYGLTDVHADTNGLCPWVPPSQLPDDVPPADAPFPGVDAPRMKRKPTHLHLP